MRIAILSDIHGNLTAFDAVLEDLRSVSPDAIYHGGDLADQGSRPIEIIDRIRGLNWPGVIGNTDEMLIRPDSLENFARQSSAPPFLWNTVREIASATRSALGDDRLDWIRNLPTSILHSDFALVHATPESCWRMLPENATDEDLSTAYSPLAHSCVVFGHTHLPRIRRMQRTPQLLINSGSVGLSYDGDPRASYLLLDNGVPTIRRIEYSIDDEIRALATCGLPGAAWTRKMLLSSSPQLP